MKKIITIPFLILLLVSLVACTNSTPKTSTTPQNPSATDSTNSVKEPITLVLGAYTTPREAYGQIIPLFQAQWKAQTGQEVIFEESYLGSGAQSRAVVEGFEADVVALSLEADIVRIQDAGLISHDWKTVGQNGMVSTSIVVFGVRPGNPLDIQDWADLTKPGVELLTPNPKTSGGAMWNILSLYGAAKRGFVEGVPATDEGATAFLQEVLGNITVMDKGARESITNYEQGVGNVIITYENEILVGQKNGQNYDMIVPRSSILIENPVAVVDSYVDKHGTREVAEAFVEFLFTQEAQQIFAEYGLRSVDTTVAAATANRYIAIKDLFTIDYFGGWKEVTVAFFGETGVYNAVLENVQLPIADQ